MIFKGFHCGSAVHNGIAAIVLLVPLCGYAAPAPAEGDHAALMEKNLFDPQRKVWPDKAPPPVSAPMLSSSDVQLYGVIVAGDYKRVILKVDGKLKHLAPQGANARPFITLAEGQSLGDYTVAEIQRQQVVFASGSARQSISFNLKTDRPPPQALPPVVQSAMVAPVDMPTIVPGLTPPPAPATPSAMPVMQPSAQQTQAAAPASSPQSPADASSSNAGSASSASSGGLGQTAPVIQGTTLADAIAAAQAASAAGTLPPAPPNPFVSKR